MNHQKKTAKTPIREFVALHLMKNVGTQRSRLLLKGVHHPRLIFRLERHELESIRGIGPKTAGEIVAFNRWDDVDRLIEKTARMGASIMTIGDEDYPRLLKEIYDPPILLWIKGDRSALHADSVAIVGTRRAGDYGIQTARKFARELSKEGLCIVSGLAYGVDGAAHRATVEAGGKTVAVLGSGIDKIYPPQHKKLAARIVESGGAVISEFAVGTDPETGNFPVRNRIVSGMSLGTLVVESGLQGGSMITAKLALDQNREVFVIPHRLGHPNSAGCNSLIKRGMGKLVQNTEDVLSEIDVHFKRTGIKTAGPENRWQSQELDKLSKLICKTLQETPLHIDHLSERLQKESHELLPKLLDLEMRRCIRQSAGKKFELV